MKKLSLLGAALAVGAVSVSAQTLITNSSIETDLTAGTVIALQCKDGNGGMDYYYNGPTQKSATLSYANLFEIAEYQDDNNSFVLKRLSDNTYIGNINNSTNQATVTAETDLANAVRFKALAASNAGAGNNANIIRFSNVAHPTFFLNTAETANLPKYHSGTGGFSVWHVFTFTAQEIDDLKNPAEPVVFNYGGVKYTATVGRSVTSLEVDKLPGVPDWFNVTSGPVAIPSDRSQEVTVEGTWALPFAFETPYKVVMRPGASTSHNLFYDGTDIYVKGKTNEAAGISPATVWYFKDGGIKDNVKTVTLHSLAADDNLGLSVSATGANGVISFAETADIFEVKANSQEPGIGFSLRRTDANFNYVNDFGGSGKLRIWAAANSGATNDPGSLIHVVALTDEDFNASTWYAGNGIYASFDPALKDAAKTAKTVESLRNLFVVSELTRDDAVIALEESKKNSALCTLLKQTGIFTEAAAVEAMTDIVIPEDATDLNQALSNAIAQIGNLDANVIIMNYLNGKKVAFKSNTPERLTYIKKGDADNKLTHSGNMTVDAVWEITTAESGASFSMKNLVSGEYATGLNATTIETEAGSYSIANINVRNDGAIAVKDNNKEAAPFFLNNNTTNNIAVPSNLQYVNAGSGNASSFWRIVLITEEQEQAWTDQAKMTGAVFGTEPGQYVKTGEHDAKIAAFDNGFDYPAAHYLMIENPMSLFDVHSILGTALVRIKTSALNVANTGNNRNMEGTPYYLSNARSEVDGKTDRISFSANGTDDSSVFVLENVTDDADNTYVQLTSLDGHALTDENGYLSIHNTQEAEGNTPMNIQVLPKEGELGAYYLAYQTNDVYAIINCWGTHSNGVYSDRHSNANSLANVGRGTFQNFNIEYVKELTVGTDGEYTLWRTPVAIHFEANAQAYTIKASGNSITTAKVDCSNGSSSFYPAGTAFLLNGKATVVVDNNTIADVVEEGTKGHHAIKEHEIEAGKVILTVATTDTENIALLEATPEPVKMNVEIPEENVIKTLAAYQVLVVAENSANDPLKNGDTLLVALGGETRTTGILEINGENNVAKTVYDLQGRRLAAPVKGINIVNGKKLLVK